MKGLFKNPSMPHPISQPLRLLTDAERSELVRVSHASSERLRRHQRALALLAVAGGKTLTDAAKAAGWKAQKTVARLLRHVPERGLAALDDLPRSGHPRSSGPPERARIVHERRRHPLRTEDGTAPWSLTTRQRTLREAPDGLPPVSTLTLLSTIHDAGSSWQKRRTWCETGKPVRKKDGRVEESDDESTQDKTAVSERASLLGERLGFQVWCEDEAGPSQTIPPPGNSWHSDNRPARQAHHYLRGDTAKLRTLFRPATGAFRAEAVQQRTTALLHPWVQRALTAILTQCPPAPERVPTGRRWHDWDRYPAADQLDRLFPPVRMLVIWDTLAGHTSHSIVQWCAEHGMLFLSTPNAGSWLTMAESVQRIIKRRALQGSQTYDVEVLKPWLIDAVPGWKRHPTPFIWGGKRHARRDRASARRHRVGGSGATTAYVIPHRLRSVH